MKNNVAIMLTKSTLALSLILFCLLGSVNYAFADWEENLKSNFDIVDTFDNLNDWRGGTGYHYDVGTLPKKNDGSPSIWTYYTNDMPAVDDWIKDHGSTYRWNSSGKSLCINYNNFVGGIAGYGPSRLGTFFGNGDPKSGYKKIYVFFMLKFHPGFFSMSGANTFELVGTCKFLDILTGFTAPDTWGTEAERGQVCDIASFHEYGMQGALLNLYGGGITYFDTLLFRQYAWKSSYNGSCYSNPNFINDYPLHSSTSSARFDSVYLSNQWIGVEFIMDVGTLNMSDASLEIYIYNQNGNIIGHNLHTGFNQLIQFDHRINKITIGGNRFGIGYEQDPGDSNENRFYVDDFIVNGSRIGPKYFQLLYGITNPEPSAPSGLKVLPNQ